MRPMTLAALAATGTLTALAAPAVAYANPTHTPKCATIVHDHINKPDNGHGTPPEWADLKFSRTTTIRCTGPGKYEVKLLDHGTLRTRAGVGTPNGSGGQISHAIPGEMHGAYWLTVTGTLAVPVHRDTSLSSTAYVTSLFASGATVQGGLYSWAYRTVCGERWLDSSLDDDGQEVAVAGNITGKTCRPRPRPTPTTGTPTPTPTGTTSAKPGDAPVPTPVNSNLPVTG